jgi:cytidylate kinase
LSRLQREELTDDKGGESFMYFITFSRKMGTNGSEIARRVADQLGYNLYDTEAIERTAQEMGFLNDVMEIDEKAPPLFLRLFSQKLEAHLERLHSVIYELASRGNAVFLGRGSHILLRSFKCAFHIRVTASLEKRIENLVERGWHREVAVKAIHQSDHERGAFIKFAFKVDWDNPVLYDIVLNMDNLTLDLAVNTVLQIAGSEEIKARSVDAMRSLEMMGLARRAEAALIEAGLKHGSSISVVEPGRIELTGFVREQSNKTEAEEVLKRVKGVKFVDNLIQVYYRNGGT